MTTISEDRLRNVRAWAAARPDMSGSEVIVGAIDELLHLRQEVVRLQGVINSAHEVARLGDEDTSLRILEANAHSGEVV